MNTSKLLRQKYRGPKPIVVVKPPCICGRGEYYHPWRFCDKYQPTSPGKSE